jgi:hypothetical protein
LCRLDVRANIARRDAKARSQIQIAPAPARQGMAIADATTADQIRNNRLKAFAE